MPRGPQTVAPLFPTGLWCQQAHLVCGASKMQFGRGGDLHVLTTSLRDPDHGRVPMLHWRSLLDHLPGRLMLQSPCEADCAV